MRPARSRGLVRLGTALALAGCGEASAPAHVEALVHVPARPAERTDDVAPRLLAPLSTATVTTPRPRLRWTPGGPSPVAFVEVCRDRACAAVEQRQVVVGHEAVPTAALAPGVHFWRVTTPGPRSSGAAARQSATWSFRVGHRAAARDASWGTTPDFDGDGVADFAVSTPYQPSSGAGNVYVFRGRHGGPAIAPDQVLAPQPGYDPQYGHAIAAAGDVNGDGFSDLAVATVAVDTSVRVEIHHGGVGGVATTPAKTLAIRATAYNHAHRHLRFEAHHVATGEDFDGDGYADVALGVGPEVTVYHGGRDGLRGAPHTVLSAPTPGDDVTALAAVGSVDGDAHADLAVVWRERGTLVYRGGPDGLSTERALTLDANEGHLVVSAGDGDGDGHADLAHTAVGLRPDGCVSTVRVFLGGAGGPRPRTDVRLDHPGCNPRSRPFSGVTLTGGDLDGDGFADLAVSTQQWGNDLADLMVFFGSPIGAPPRRAGPWLIGGDSNSFKAIAGAGDLDGDARDDLLVYSYALLGIASGAPTRVYLQPPSADTWLFGYSIAGAR